jgi:hypothetical protein
MGIDRVFLDKTGPGSGFQKEVEQRLGRKAVGFNFSDKDEIKRMMGDFNYALHNDMMTLVPDNKISGQLEAIVKEKRHETSKPKFSGKKHAPNGKDDLAMALVLAAYPPDYDADRSVEPETRKNVSGHIDEEPGKSEGSRNSGFQKMISGSSSHGSDSNSNSAFGVQPDTGNDRRYERRHSR